MRPKLQETANFLKISFIVSQKRTDIKDSKNTIVGSNITGGEKVHIGDIIHNHASPSGDGNATPKKKSSFDLFKIVLFSFTLIGVSITVKKFVLIDMNPKAEEIGQPTPSDTTTKQGGKAPNDAEGVAAPIVLPKQPPSTPANKPQPIEKRPEILSNYIDLGQSANTAMLTSSSTELPAFQAAVKAKFTGISDSYFRPAFPQKFGNSLEKMDVAALREIGLAEKIKCTCQIIEQIKYEPNEVAGVHMVTARGRIWVHILNLDTGKLDQIAFTENGSGLSEATALESLEEHLLQSDKLNSIHTQQCK